jgi:AcrR family transcriptional regulator
MSSRDRILDAAAEVMRTKGMAHGTTREIARAAGFSEATLYKHFADKSELLVAVMRERSPGFTMLAEVLNRRSGASLVDNLADLALGAIAFYHQQFPMMASIFSDPAIFGAHLAGLRSQGAGPHNTNMGVMAYLSGEQTRGRVRADADLYAAAALLVGACMQHAFLGHMGWAERRTDQEAAAAFARELARLLEPEE